MIAALPSDHRSSRPTAAHSVASVTKTMGVSLYDAVTSLLMAIIWLVGTLVAVLLLLWWLNTAVQPQRSIPPARAQWTSAVGSLTSNDFEQPSESEVAALLTPDGTELMAQLEPAVLRIAATMGEGVGEPLGQRSGHPGSTTDGPPGDGLDGDDIVPRHERWVLLFNANSRADYAGQLDAHRIELGVFGGGVSGLDYAGRLASQPQSRHESDPTQEQRLYFSWTMPTPLAAFESELLRQAGIETAGRNVVKFLPSELENQLAMLELQHAQENGVDSVTEIAKTVFETRGGAPFAVVSQRYRKSNRTHK
ncbi:hypothetical protein [Stieleria varia]|uniref:Uncharacterized protein n=1 Tax=Stieleria varia TaxID=2528005 RepID=A0A5C6B8A4_9BACT|nr:hypothetical protein [Stieleria varia]TWU07997.1 hypothetical protein Pla52n_05750 [Stieleria varia]